MRIVFTFALNAVLALNTDSTVALDNGDVAMDNAADNAYNDLEFASLSTVSHIAEFRGLFRKKGVLHTEEVYPAITALEKYQFMVGIGKLYQKNNVWLFLCEAVFNFVAFWMPEFIPMALFAFEGRRIADWIDVQSLNARGGILTRASQEAIDNNRAIKTIDADGTEGWVEQYAMNVTGYEKMFWSQVSFAPPNVDLGNFSIDWQALKPDWRILIPNFEVLGFPFDVCWSCYRAGIYEYIHSFKVIGLRVFDRFGFFRNVGKSFMDGMMTVINALKALFTAVKNIVFFIFYIIVPCELIDFFGR